MANQYRACIVGCGRMGGTIDEEVGGGDIRLCPILMPLDIRLMSGQPSLLRRMLWQKKQNMFAQNGISPNDTRIIGR